MSEDTERMKRHLEFLKKERARKEAELKQAQGLMQLATASALFGGGGGLLRQQQQLHRIQDLAAEIRKLTFEIEDLEAELKKKESKSVRMKKKKK